MPIPGNHPQEYTTFNHETETARLWELLATVVDPEIPVLSIEDLGIVRSVTLNSKEGQEWEGKVIITPTYSGCPAMDAISMDIRLKLAEHGYGKITLQSVLSPAWTTGWMSEAGKEKLKLYGIAPPGAAEQICDKNLFETAAAVQCPRCGSYQTSMVSRFGSTACKAFYTCGECLEPFDYFKCH